VIVALAINKPKINAPPSLNSLFSIHQVKIISPTRAFSKKKLKWKASLIAVSTKFS
jgi:hypothetical protein